MSHSGGVGNIADCNSLPKGLEMEKEREGKMTMVCSLTHSLIHYTAPGFPIPASVKLVDYIHIQEMNEGASAGATPKH